MKRLFLQNIFVKNISNLCKCIYTPWQNDVKKYLFRPELKIKCDTNFFQPMLKLKISPWREIWHVTVLSNHQKMANGYKVTNDY